MNKVIHKAFAISSMKLEVLFVACREMILVIASFNIFNYFSKTKKTLECARKVVYTSYVKQTWNILSKFAQTFSFLLNQSVWSFLKLEAKKIKKWKVWYFCVSSFRPSSSWRARLRTMDLRPLRPTVNSAAADQIFRVIWKLSSIQKIRIAK